MSEDIDGSKTNLSFDGLSISLYGIHEETMFYIGGYVDSKPIVIVTDDQRIISIYAKYSEDLLALKEKYNSLWLRFLDFLGIGFDGRSEQIMKIFDQKTIEIKDLLPVADINVYLSENEQGLSDWVVSIFRNMRAPTFEERVLELENEMANELANAGIVDTSDVRYFQEEFLSEKIKLIEKFIQSNRHWRGVSIDSDTQKIDSYLVSTLRFMDYLKAWREKVSKEKKVDGNKLNSISENSTNLERRVFTNEVGMKILKAWFEDSDRKLILADSSYLFYKMRKESLIDERTTHLEFIDVLISEFGFEPMERLKSVEFNSDLKRDKMFQLILLKIKSIL